jgi:hypothetical protein
MGYNCCNMGIDMRKIILLALGLWPLLGIAQGNLGLVWSPAMPVATATSYDNIRPQVAVAGADVPLVLWCRSVGGRHGYVARWNGNAFDAPFKINPTGGMNAYTVEGPNIVARGDTAYIVYVSTPTSSAQVLLRSCFDGGQTWNPPQWVDSLNTDLPTFGNVEMLPGGQPIVTYIRQTINYASPRWVVRKSTDGGQTWLAEVPVSGAAPGSDVCDCCTGHTYSHEGKVIEVFRNNDANLRDFWATVSTDGGTTFPNAIDLDSTDWMLSGCPSSGSSSLLRGDSLYTAFMSQGSNGLARVWLGAAHLGTGQLAYNRMLNGAVPGTTIQNYVTLSGMGDTMVVACMESSGGNPEIYLRYSFSGMAGLWANPLVNVTEMAAGQQNFPDILWKNGKLHLVWQDDATNLVMYRTAVVGIPANLGEGFVGTWKIFPNPARGSVQLANMPTFPCTLRLLDAQGQLLYRLELGSADRVRLDLDGLASGLYFVELSAEGKHLGTKKLVLVD